MPALSTLGGIWDTSMLLAEEPVPPHPRGTSPLLPYRWPNYKERKEEYCGDEKDISLCQLRILACVEVILLVGKYRGTLGLWLTRPSQPCLLPLRDLVMVQEKHLLLAAIFSGA